MDTSVTEDFEIPPDIYNTLSKVSELSKKLKPCCLVKAEKSAAKNLGIKLQTLSSDCSDLFDQTLVNLYEKLFTINRSQLTSTKIGNCEQGAVIANQDYSKQEPIFLFGVTTKKTNLATVSSTKKNEILLGPLRTANTSKICNAKYLKINNFQNIFICVATKPIIQNSQILINYEPGKCNRFWVR